MYSELRDSALCSKITQFYKTTDTTVSHALEVKKAKTKRRFTEFCKAIIITSKQKKLPYLFSSSEGKELHPFFQVYNSHETASVDL